MSEEFAENWKEKEAKKPFYRKVKEIVRPIKDVVFSPSPLKPRLELAVKRIQVHIQRLGKAAERLMKRDKLVFAHVVKAYSRRDMARANVFASELGEIRKVEKMIMHAKLALEQIVLRLNTVSELGNVVSGLAPTVDVLRSIRTGIAGVLPEAERELEKIGDLLSEVIIDAGQSTGSNIDFKASSEDAQKILNEAALIAEQKIKKKLPEIPAGVPTVRDKVPTQT